MIKFYVFVDVLYYCYLYTYDNGHIHLILYILNSSKIIERTGMNSPCI